MKKTYGLTVQQSLIIKAITEGLPLQYEACAGKWVDSFNTVSELFTVVSTQGGSSLVYRIKPEVRSVEAQLFVSRGIGGEVLCLWRSSHSRSAYDVQRAPDFKRWVGDRQTIELETAQ